MHLYAAFYADYTTYAYGFCFVFLANLSCKLSLVSGVDDFNEADSIQKSIHAF